MKENLTTASDSSSSESSLPDTMEIERNDDRLTFDNVFFTGSGHKRCVICRTPVSSQMIVMPKSARLDLLLIHRLFAPHGTRCCSSHLINGLRLLPNEYINMEDRLQRPTLLSPQEMQDLLNDMFCFFDDLRGSPRLDFDSALLRHEDYEAWTGWSKEQFDDMFKELSLFLRPSPNRTSRNTLAIFWIKVKTNLSFRQIGSLFNMPGNLDNRRLPAAAAFNSVRELFVNHFVPEHLGAGHISVDDAKTHNTAYSKVCLFLPDKKRKTTLNAYYREK